jgi:cysteine desulfurase family protein
MRAMGDFFLRGGGNPGRSGHGRSIDAGRVVLRTREGLAEFFNIRDSSKIIFTKNATEALNIAIYGLAGGGDHVVTTSMEHNSVMRPLTHLRDRGCSVSVVSADTGGLVSPESILKTIEANTKLVIVTHASNVTGTVNDIGRIGEICREKNILFLVDAAQTVGGIPIDVEKMHIDFLAFSGHKGLLGPQGTGGLCIGGDELIDPLMRGGTGSVSDREVQPDFLPDRFESGTLNVVGIAGLGAAVEWIRNRGVETIMRHEQAIREIMVEELWGKDRFTLYTVESGLQHTGVLSLNIGGFSPSKVGEILDRQYGIQTRIGLHCAPSAHRSIGTFPDGTVRLSWGAFTRIKDAEYVANSLKEIASLSSRPAPYL